MDRATVIDRKGNKQAFMGASSYVVKANWIGGVTVFADGVPIAYFFRPISLAIGMASSDDIDNIVRGQEEHRAKLMGIKL